MGYALNVNEKSQWRKVEDMWVRMTESGRECGVIGL